MNDPLALDILADKEKMGQLINDLGVIESSSTLTSIKQTRRCYN
jgi:hypothetical protein